MSNEYDDLDDNDPSLPTKLRGQIKELQKANKALTDQVTEFTGAARTRTLSEVIKSKNLNPLIAGLVPKDLADDALEEWLNQYAEVFGGQPAATQDANAAAAAEATRQAEAMNGSGSGSPGDVLSRVNAAENWEELQAALSAL